MIYKQGKDMEDSKNKPRTVVIYARVSTEHEAQLSALENQVQYYDNILAAHPNWKLYGKYIDEGITGTSTKKRKNFLRMMDDAAAGCFDLIITREVSRFARNTVDTLQETRKLKKIGVEVWFTEDNIWTLNDEDGELRLTIMATLAQNESKKTSLRVRAGQMVSFQNGIPYGNGNILGYNRVGREYIKNEEQAAIVREIFDLYLAGNGMQRIKDEMERTGRKTSTGRSNWTCAAVSRILQNPFYSGTIVYRKQITKDYLEQKKVNNHGEVEKIIVEGKHEPIVTKEEFAEVQRIIECKRLDAPGKPNVGRKMADYVLTRKMECYCGHRMNRKNWNRKADGTASHAYQCYASIRTGTISQRKLRNLPTEGYCQSPMVPEWKVLAMAKEIFGKFWNNREEVLKIANELLDKDIAHELDAQEHNKYDNLKKQIEKLQKKMDNLTDMRLEETISKEYYLQKKEEIENKQISIQKELNKLAEIDNIETDDYENKIVILKYVLEQDFSFDEYNIPEEVLDAFIRKIIVYPDHFDWYLNFDNKIVKCLASGTSRKPEVQCLIDELPPQPIHGTGCYC